MYFYAIRKGIHTGIVNTWEECKARVEGYNGAVYKKFSTQESAEEFLSHAPDPPKKESLKEPGKAPKIRTIETTSPKDYYVYTDGSCSNNGKPNAAAGIGIFFGEADKRNVSQRIQGKQSNNTAELSALVHLYPILQRDLQTGKQIGIVSDSEYAIRCATTYGAKQEKEGWKNDIPNKELVKTLYELYKDESNAHFIHIMAHTGKTDPHSVGNEGADRLANEAIGLTACPYAHLQTLQKKSRIYLEVPYTRKEEAKALGAQWDPSKKKWYVYDRNTTPFPTI